MIHALRGFDERAEWRSVRWQLRPMGAGGQGASVAVRLKAYPDTNPFRSERENPTREKQIPHR